METLRLTEPVVDGDEEVRRRRVRGAGKSQRDDLAIDIVSIPDVGDHLGHIAWS